MLLVELLQVDTTVILILELTTEQMVRNGTQRLDPISIILQTCLVDPSSLILIFMNQLVGAMLQYTLHKCQLENLMELLIQLQILITTVDLEMLKLYAQKSISSKLINMLGKPLCTSAMLPLMDITQAVTAGGTTSKYGSKIKPHTAQVLNIKLTV